MFFLLALNAIAYKYPIIIEKKQIIDSVIYFGKTSYLKGYVYNHVGKKDTDISPTSMKFFVIGDSLKYDNKTKLDVSSPDVFLLLTPEDFIYLQTSLNKKIEKKYLSKDAFENCFNNNIIRSKTKKNRIYVFDCSTEFTQIFIDVKVIKTFFWISKSVVIPKSGYVKCLIPAIS